MKKKNNPLENDALIQEVTDDVKNDELRVLWNKYGLFIIIGVALALTAAVSFETFKNWIKQRNEELSNAYAVALSLHSQGKLDDSLNVLNDIVKHTSGVYSDAAKLQISNIYFQQNKPQEATALLAELAANAGNEQMQEIAALKLASIKLDTNAPADEVKMLLQPLTEKGEASYNVARELLAMLAIRDGKLEEAKGEYEKIISSPNVTDDIKSRAQDMLSLLDEKK